MRADRAEPMETAHGTILGTPGYMAPEQARGEIERLDERADIYSLGAILRFLVGGEGFGEAPKSGSKGDGAMAAIASTNASAPKAVAAIASKAMAASPSGRYGTVTDLVEDVARFLDGLPVSAYPENIFQRLARWARRYRVAIGLVLAYLLVRALLLLWLRR